MSKDPDMVCYGQKHVFKAFEAKAIQTLMISDSLFRTKELLQRKKFTNLVDISKKKGIDVLIFSSLHSSGEKLNNLTGIAAILKFPMALESEEMDEQEEIVENFRVRLEDREDIKEENSEMDQKDRDEADKISKELEAFSLEDLDEGLEYNGGDDY